MKKTVIMMLYPTSAEANMGYERVFVSLKDPIVQSRKNDLIETTNHRLHFHSISSNYYKFLCGYEFDEVWVDERINLNSSIEDGITLEQFIRSRKRKKHE
jgi:hypothetical protein